MRAAQARVAKVGPVLRERHGESHFLLAIYATHASAGPMGRSGTRCCSQTSSTTSWARTLIARGRPEGLDRALHMLEQAEETAARLGGGLVTREVAACRAALAAIGG